VLSLLDISQKTVVYVFVRGLCIACCCVPDWADERESEAMAAEFNELKEELKEAKEDGKARINNAMANLKDKAYLTNEQIRRKMDEAKSQLEAKVHKTEEQVKDAGGKRKAKLEKQIDAI